HVGRAVAPTRRNLRLGQLDLGRAHRSSIEAPGKRLGRRSGAPLNAPDLSRALSGERRLLEGGPLGVLDPLALAELAVLEVYTPHARWAPLLLLCLPRCRRWRRWRWWRRRRGRGWRGGRGRMRRWGVGAGER